MTFERWVDNRTVWLTGRSLMRGDTEIMVLYKALPLPVGKENWFDEGAE